MGIEDLANQGKDLFDQNKDKLHEVLKSARAEGVSDAVLDKIADFAKGVLPGNLDSHVDEVRRNVDGAIGDR